MLINKSLVQWRVDITTGGMMWVSIVNLFNSLCMRSGIGLI
jgi:hypothetical protein